MLFNRTVDMKTNKSERASTEFCINLENNTISVEKVSFNITEADEKEDRIYLLGNKNNVKVLFVIFKNRNYVDIFSEDIDMVFRLYKDKYLY